MRTKPTILRKVLEKLTLVRVRFLEWRYSTHLRIRFLHDKTYEKGGAYKKWTDKKYSSAIHKATFTAFIFAFSVFSFSQVIAPYYFSPQGRPATGISINVENPKTREVTWEQYKKQRAMMKDVQDLGNGTTKAKIYGSAVQYQDTDGVWKDIDTNIKGSGRNLYVKEAPYKATFSANAGEDLRFETEGEYLINSYLEASDNAGTVQGNKITYLDAYSKTDIERIFKNTEVKQNIVLKEPGHPTVFKEKLESSMEIKVLEDNSLAYLKDGKKVATTPPIEIVDSNKFEKKVKLSYENKVLTIELPEIKYLSYPLVIDPSTNIYGASGDDAVAGYWEGPCSGGPVYSKDSTSTTMGLRFYSNGTDTEYYDGFFRFSLTGIPANSIITAATAYFFVQSVDYGSGEMYLSHSMSMNPGNDSAETLWGTGTYSTISTNYASSNSYLSQNVTSAVQSDYAASRTYSHYRIRVPAENFIPYITFRTSDYTGTSSDPYLAVTYVAPPNPPTGFSGSALSTTSIQWNWTDASSDEDGFRVHDGADAQKCTAGVGGTSCNEGSLTANTSYTRHVHAYNAAAGNSTASNTATKYTAAVNPNVTSDKTASTWYNTSDVVFTNAAGFGAGGLTKYKYLWDSTPTQTAATINTSGTDWSTGTLTKSMSAGDNYLHVTSYNGDNVQNTTVANYGPYRYDYTTPTVTVSSTALAGLVSGSTSYVNGTQDHSMAKASVTLSDNVSTTLDVQFSEDGTTWGKYDGTADGAGSNFTTGGATWGANTYLTLTGITSTPTLTNILGTNNNGIWKLSNSNPTYMRVRDAAGNVSTDYNFSDNLDTTTYKDAGATTADWMDGRISLTNSISYTAKASVPFGIYRGAHASYSITDQKIYTYAANGGFNNWLDFAAYNPLTNTWETKANIPATPGYGSGIASGSTDGLIYVSRGTSSTTFYAYNPNTNTWETKAPIPVTPGEGSGLVWSPLTSRYYLLCGNYTTNFYEYNPSANSWSAKTPTPAVVYKGGTIGYNSSNNKIYVLRGGNDNITPYYSSPTLWEYDPSLDSWSTKANAPANIGHGSTITYYPIYDRMFATQGGIGTGSVKFYEYNANTDTWLTKNDTPELIKDGAGLVYSPPDQKMYLLAGWGSNNYQITRSYSITSKEAQSLTVDGTAATIKKVTLNNTQILNGQTIQYYLSANGGTNWEGPVTLGSQWTFSNNGSDLRWKATLSTSNASVTPSIENISVTYTIDPVSDSITLDTTAPTSPGIPTVTTTPNNTGNQTVSWTQVTEANFANYQVQRKLGAGAYGNIGSPITNIATVSYADNSALAEGTYYYQVIASDSAGNSTTSSESAAHIVDKSAPSAPTLSCTTYTHNAWSNSSASSTCSITDTATPSPRTAVGYSTDGGSGWTATTGSPPALSFSFTPNQGTTNIVMRITDTGGGPTSSNTYIIKRDSVAPTEAANPFVLQAALANGTNKIKKGDTYYIYGNATDATSGVSTLTTNASSITTGQTAVSMTTAGGPWTVNSISYAYRTAQLTADAGLTDGTKSPTLTTTDVATNTFTPVGYSVTADSAPPTGTVAIAGGATYTNSTTPTLNLTYADGTGAGVWLMQFSNNGSSWGVTTDTSGVVTDTSGNCTTPKVWDGTTCWNAVAATKTGWYLSSGTDGSRTVYVKYKDNAGNSSSDIPTITIGTQAWMKKNMDVGTRIDNTVDQTNNAVLEKYCYNNDPNNCTTYGGLYWWSEAMQYSVAGGAQGICPTNFHVPTDAEFKTLEMFLGMTQAQADGTNWRGTDEGTKLKSGGASGFEGLLAGWRSAFNGSYNELGTTGTFWSSSSIGGDAWFRNLGSGNTTVYRNGNYGNGMGRSVRCLANDASSTIVSDSITLDTTAPSFGTVTPATAANRNTGNVQFTLSEEMQAGAYLRFTSTTANGGEVVDGQHTYNLTGAELTTLTQQTKTVTGLINGNSYTLSLYGQDLAGTTDNTADSTGIKYDTAAPTFTIAYYTDTGLTTPLTNNYMKVGTYFIKITSTDYTGLSGAPTVNIAAEGTANDISGGTTTLVSGSDYKYTRAISNDAAAIGTVAEDITVTATDLAGNTATNTTVTGEKYTDTVNPTLPTVTIASNNANTAKAKVGDRVTLTIASSENIGTPTVTMATPLRAATVSGANQNWTAYIDMAPTGDTEGNIAFNVTYSDIAGNAGTAVSTKTGGSDVQFDKTAPTGSFMVNNLLSNSSFETDGNSDGVADSWGSATAGVTSSIDATTKFYGSASQKAVFTGTDVNWFTQYQNVSGAQASTSYIASVYIKTDSISTGSGNGVQIEAYSTGAGGTTYRTSTSVTGTTGWTRYTTAFTSRSDATTVGVRLRRMSGGGSITGSAWYDAIQLEKKGAPASPYMAWADATTGNNVYSTASDSGSGLYQMWISNDNFATGSYETYNTQKAWALATGDGAKTVSMKIKDNAGNETALTPQGITLDTNAPGGFSLSSPGDWSWVNTPNPTLIWQGHNNGGTGGKANEPNLWKYEVYVKSPGDGDFVRKKVQEVSPSASEWQFDYLLPQGTNIWYIAATDFTNRTTETSLGAFNIQYDTVKPTSSISAPTAGAYITTSSYDITGSASNGGSGSALSVVEVSTNGGLGYSSATGTSSWSYSWTTPVDGSYNIKSRATDVATNVEDVGTGINVTVDKTPVNSSSAVVNDGAGADVDWTNSTTALTANWSGFSDANGIAKYKYAIGTTAGGTNIVNWTDNSTNTFVTVNGTFTAGQTYYFTIKAYDASLAESNAATKTANGISVDTTLPPFVEGVSNDVTIANAYYGPNTWVAGSTINGTASDTGSAPAGASGISKTEITIQRSSDSQYWTGSTWGASTPLNVGTGGTWTYTLASGNLSNNVTYTVVSTTTDVAGNVQSPSGSDTFIYDNTTTAPSANVGVNLVKNSSFENDGDSNGLADTWTNYLYGGDTTTNTLDTDRVIGAKSQKMTVTHSAGGVWLKAPLNRLLTTGDSYALSFWAKANGTVTANVDIRNGPSTNVYSSNLPINLTTAWTKYTLPFNSAVTGSDGEVTFRMNTNNQFWFDAVQLEKNPTVTDYVDDGYMNEARWSASAISGTAADAVSGVQKTEITISNGTNYWNPGTGWGASSWINVGSGGTWSYGSAGIAASNFIDGQTMTVTAKTTDNAGNVTSTVTDAVYWDKTAPTAPAIADPPNPYLNSSTYNSSGDGSNTIRGTAADTGGSNIGRTEITIQRADNSQYWTGSAWGAQTWIPVGNGASWNYTGLTSADLINGIVHRVNATTYDQAGSSTAGTQKTFTYDNSGPVAGTNVFTASGTDDTKITLTWDKWTDTPGGVKEYKIYRSTASNTPEANGSLSEPRPSYPELVQTVTDTGVNNYSYVDQNLVMGWYYYKMEVYDNGNTKGTDVYSHSKTNFKPLIGAVEGDINLTTQTSNNNIGANKSSVDLTGDAGVRTVTFTWSAKDQDHNNPSSDITENRFTVKKPDSSTLETFTGNGSSANGSWTFSSVATSDTRGYNNTATFTFASTLPYGRYTALSSVNDTIGGTHNISSNSVNVDLPPSYTSALNVVGATNSSATLTWSPPQGRTNDSAATTGVANYTLQRKVSSAGDETYADVITINSGDNDCLDNACYNSGTNTYTVTNGPLPLETYIYRVKATDISGNAGGWSVSGSITVPDTAAPNAVTDLSVASLGGDGTSVELSWTIPSDNSDTSAYANKGVRKFNIYRRADSNFVQGNDIVKTLVKGTDSEWGLPGLLKSVGDTITYNATGLSPQTTYYFWITPVDAGLPEGDAFGENEQTAVDSGPTNYNRRNATTLAIPQGMTIRSASDQLTAGNARIVVSWTPLTAGYDSAPAPYDFANYTIQKKIGLGSWADLTTISNIATNYFVDDHLDPDKTYYYKVKTVNANTDSSNFSSEVSMRPDTIDTEKPTITFTPATDLTSTASSITVHFHTSENATPVVEYDTQANFVSNGSLGQSKGTGTFASEHTVVLSGLLPSTTYRINLKATDAAGNTQTQQDTGNVPYSKATTADSTPPTNPDVPTGYSSVAKTIQISSGNWYNYTAPYFEWNAGSDADSAISGYYVYFGTSAAGDPAGYQSGAGANTYTASVATTGIYYLRVKTKDAANNTSAAVTLFEYKFDNTAPTSAVSTPANGAKLNALSAVTGTAADQHSNLNMIKVRIKRSTDNNYWNGGTSWVADSNTWRTADSGLGSWTLSTLPAWASGTTYYISSMAVDNASNEGSASAEISFTFDNTAPVISRSVLSATTSNTINKIHQGDTYYVYAEVSEAVGVAGVSANGSELGSAASISLTSDGGPWTVDGQSYNYRSVLAKAGNIVAAGAKTIGVSASDTSVNNATVSNISVTVDNTAVGFSSIGASFNPTKGAYKTGDEATITFTASEALASNPSVTINGHAATYDSNNALAYTYTYIVQSSDPDGATTVTVSGTETAGNAGSTTSGTLFTVDNTAPTRPTVNAVTSPTNADTQVVTGAAEANSKVTITGGAASAEQQLSGGATVYSILVTLNQNAANTLSVVSADAAGNESLAAATSVLHDNIAPDTTKITLVAPNGSHLNTTTPTFVWSTDAGADSGSGLDHYELWIDGAKNTDGPAEIPAVSSPTQKHITTALGEASHTWFVKIFDKAGNSSSKEATSLSVAVDLTKPASSVTSPNSHLYLNGATLAITGTALKGSSADISQVYVSAAKKGAGLNWQPVTALTYPAWSYTWSIPSGNDGDYFIISKAVDAAGNEENYGSGVLVTVDKTPTLISAITESDVTTASANINWTTDEVATSVLEYGLTNVYGTTVTVTDLDVNHNIRIDNLTDNTTYHYRVKSTDRAGNETISADRTFATVSLDHTPPVISAVQSQATAGTAAVTWGTNEVATSQVEYALDAGFAGSQFTVFDEKHNKDHNVSIGSLTHNTTYYFRVISKDQSDNESISTAGSFTTTRIPGINNGSISDEVDNNVSGMKISWVSDIPTTSYVEYGLVGVNFDDVVGEEELKTSHELYVYDLMPLAEYQYRVKGKNDQGNEIVGPSGTFTAPSFFDKTPPVVTFAVQPIADNVGIDVGVSRAEVQWKTNEPSDSVVEYKKEGETEYRTLNGDPKLVSNDHAVIIKSLSAQSKYYFKVKSRDGARNAAETQEFDFTTLSIGMSQPQVAATSSSAAFSWSTVFDSTTQIEYQKQNSNIPSKIEGSDEKVKGHSFTVKNLSPGQYTYKVKSMDIDNNIAESPLLTFTIPTSDTGTLSPPQAGKIEERDITATSAKITWTSTLPTSSWVDYGTSPGSYSLSAGNDVMTVDHVITLEGLTPGQTYYYKIRGMDANGVEYQSQEYSFIALAKPNISSVKVTNITSFTATVVVEVTKDVQATVNFGKDGKMTEKAGGTGLAKTHEIKLSNLEDGATYSLSVDVKDSTGNNATSSAQTFSTPLDVTGPVIGEVKIDLLPLGSDDETAQAIISWTTDKPSTTKVEYDEGVIGGKYSKASIEDDSLNKSHTVIVKDLNPATTYHFRLVSRDKRDNKTISTDYTFVTPAKEKSIWQLILKSIEETFSWVKNIGSFFQNLGKKTK